MTPPTGPQRCGRRRRAQPGADRPETVPAPAVGGGRHLDAGQLWMARWNDRSAAFPDELRVCTKTAFGVR